MKFEKLTENKIRITLNINDLNENNIDSHSIMSSSIESQNLFYIMLDKAEKEIGFITKDYKLLIEALAIPEDNFIFTITRLTQEFSGSTIKKPVVKRKTCHINNKILVYKFDTFDDFCEFGNYLKLNAPEILCKLKTSKLFSYNSDYYLLIDSTNLHIVQIKIMDLMLLEFSKFIHNSGVFSSKLVEYGNLIIGQNPFSIIKKYLN